MATLVSVYDLPSDVANVVRKLKARGFDELTTYSPAPFTEIEEAEDPRPSTVRLLTLIGGLTGVFTGFFIQIWMSNDWPIKIAGKNFASIPPYWIIGFELTILFGGLLTFVGLMVFGGLYPRKVDEHYSPRFSAEEFGVVVTCEERDVAEVEALMRGHNAKEVSLAAH
jgi:molybdopterin-containing oxidoreductase family membrane subunit